MKRGPAIGIGVGIVVVIIAAVYTVSGIDSIDENSIGNNDQPQTQEIPGGDSGEGKRIKVTLDDSMGSTDATP